MLSVQNTDSCTGLSISCRINLSTLTASETRSGFSVDDECAVFIWNDTICQ